MLATILRAASASLAVATIAVRTSRLNAPLLRSAMENQNWGENRAQAILKPAAPDEPQDGPHPPAAPRHVQGPGTAPGATRGVVSDRGPSGDLSERLSTKDASRLGRPRGHDAVAHLRDPRRLAGSLCTRRCICVK